MSLCGDNGPVNATESPSGVVLVVSALDELDPRAAKRLGVMVVALPELALPDDEVVLLRPHRLLDGDLGDVEACKGGEDHGSGELRAEWNTSKTEEDGV